MTAHTALHAPQAHAAKSDDASPFSALLEALAPKADKPKDKSASDDDAKDTGTDVIKADNKTDAKADPSIGPAEKSDKTEKSDKPEDTAKAAETEMTDATQVVAPDQPPVVPPVAVAAMPAPITPAATPAPSTPAATPAPITPAATPAPITPAATPTPSEANSDIEAANGAANAPTPASQTDKTDKTAAAPRNAATGQAQASAADPAVTDAAATQDDAADQTNGSAGDTTATNAAATQDMPQDIKGAAKPAPRKPLQAAADTRPGKPADAIKTGVTKSDSTKTDSTRPDAPQPDKVAAADTPAAPKPAPAASTNLAVHDITAPQAPQTNAPGAPSITQHVQVAAPAPNMPALAVEISAKSQSGAKQFDIRLDPPELGRVEVRLSIDATGKASAHLSADQPQTLDLLQKDSTSLMRALRDAGLNVSQDGLNFSLRQQSHQDSGAHQGGGRGNARTFALTATTGTEATATSAAYRRPADGRIDISV